MSLNLWDFILMRNVHHAVMPILLLLTSGWGCATVPQTNNLSPIKGGPGETLKRLITLMETPSEPQPVSVPTTEIPASSCMGDGGPGATYKHLLTLMETPAVKSQVTTSRALAPAVPSTPPATAMAPLPPQELTPPPAYRMDTAAINLGMQTPPPSDSLRSKEEQLFAGKFYRIGPEDVIRVSVWENPELTMDVTVRPDGKISFPLIKEIHAADLTPMELSYVITQNLKEYMKDPQVTVILTQTNSQKIYLVGNVLRPGSYALRNEMTVLQALSLAGGFTIFASPRDMKLISGTGTRQEIRKINFYKMIEDSELNYHMLKPGDTIVIP